MVSLVKANTLTPISIICDLPMYLLILVGAIKILIWAAQPLTEAPENKTDSDSFEPRNAVKGDVARMMFYMDVRYEGGDETSTPNLIFA